MSQASSIAEWVSAHAVDDPQCYRHGEGEEEGEGDGFPLWAVLLLPLPLLLLQLPRAEPKLL